MDIPLADLTAVLAAEEHALRAVLFRHVEAFLLVAAGEHRFVTRALDDLAVAEERLAVLELARASLIPDLAAAEIVGEAAENARPAFTGLLDSLGALYDEITARRASTAAMAAQRAETTSRALAGVGARGYRPDGSAGL